MKLYNLPLYSFIYPRVMRLAHRFHWHHAPPIYPDGDKVLRCSWCGFQQCVRKAKRPGEVPPPPPPVFAR